MLATKLSSKYQMTVPQEVRKFLHIEKGDHLIWEIEDGVVTVKKATPFDIEYAQSVQKTLSEWNSENDEEAYRDL